MEDFKENNEMNENEMQAITIPTPKQLYDILDKYVIGQDEAKKVLSVAVYNHYKRFLINIYGANINGDRADEFENVTIDKANVLLCGNSGTGKTFMIKTLAKFLGIPCYIADSTKLTESGYVGDDVETILTGLLHEADGNVMRAQSGICILDEIDKLSRRGENASLTRDVGAEGVQQGLLKIVEGTKVGVPPNGGRKHPEQQLIDMDTTNILFIGIGAFDGLDKIVERRINTSSIGFNSVRKAVNDDEKNINLLNKVRQEDLKKFGLIPELIGRFPIITHTNPLSEDDLVRILTEPQNSIIKQYQKMLYMDGVNLSFTDGALKLVAKVANSTKTGARGLRSILENVLTNVMFDYAGNVEVKDIKIDAKYIENSLQNKYDLDEIKKKAA
jgi:ATP-dependent Clp protease ATP-binding subunit ClpX